MNRNYNNRKVQNGPFILNNGIIRKSDLESAQAKKLLEKYVLDPEDLDNDSKEELPSQRKYNNDLLMSNHSNAISKAKSDTIETHKQEPVLEGIDINKKPKINEMIGYNPTPQSNINIYNPTLTDIINYSKSRGIVGEEKNSILQLLCAVNGIHFGIEGSSGSGKTNLLNTLISLLPSNDVYIMDMSSDVAIFNDSEKINSKRYFICPELQKIVKGNNSVLNEVLKGISQGSDVNRIVSSGNGKTKSYTINSDLTIIYTLATENNYKKDEETSRRFVKLYTDCSEEHIKKILDVKVQSRLGNDNGNISSEKISIIKKHIKYLNDKHFEIIDPFAGFMNNYMPETPKTISYINHYFSLLDASAKFHIYDRVKSDNRIFLNLDDHFFIHSFYHGQFCDTLAELNKDKDYSCIIDNARRDVDWKAAYDAGISVMKEKFSHCADEWQNKNIQNGNIGLYNPINQKKVIL